MIAALVLDASATLACLLPDEQPNDFPAWVDHVATARIVVPPTWSIEVANGLTTAVSRKRIPASSISPLTEPLGVWRIAIEPPGVVATIRELARVAQDYELSAYDAAYLEIAMRLGLPLVTLDLRLAKAAKSAGVKLLA